MLFEIHTLFINGPTQTGKTMETENVLNEYIHFIQFCTIYTTLRCIREKMNVKLFFINCADWSRRGAQVPT
jgi:Cdc6-like AAA superfamily ATPase